MTNKERDSLLLSISNGINNLYENYFSLDKKLEKTEDNLRSEIKKTEDKLKTEIKNTEDKLRTEIKNTENKLRTEFKQETDKLRTEFKQETDKLRTEFKQETDKLRDEMNAQNQINIDSIVDAFHETWKIDTRDHNIINNRLNQHDKEIKALKERLA